MKRTALIVLPFLAATTLAACRDNATPAQNDCDTRSPASCDQQNASAGGHGGGGGGYSGGGSRNSYVAPLTGGAEPATATGSETASSHFNSGVARGGFGEAAGAHGGGHGGGE